MKNYLLSYPRSGNTWLRYCIEVLTNKRTIGYLSSDDKDSGVLPKNRTNEEPILIKRHETSDIKEGKLILIVRNYKEVIIRHNSVKTIMEDYSSNNRVTYLKLLDFYHTYKGKKMIVYYEDLIGDLKNTIEKVLNFLGLEVGFDSIDDFFSNIEEHKLKSLSIYGESKTKGKTTIYHSSKLTNDELIEWDNFLLKNNKVIFEKYLKRYKS